MPPTGAGAAVESFEFEIINSVGKSWVFEATSLQEKKEWIKTIEAAMSDYIAGSSYRKEENSICEEDRTAIQSRPGNAFCADCNSTSECVCVCVWVCVGVGVCVCICVFVYLCLSV